jgi:hypothetical protein
VVPGSGVDNPKPAPGKICEGRAFPQRLLSLFQARAVLTTSATVGNYNDVLWEIEWRCPLDERCMVGSVGRVASSGPLRVEFRSPTPQFVM